MAVQLQKESQLLDPISSKVREYSIRVRPVWDKRRTWSDQYSPCRSQLVSNCLNLPRLTSTCLNLFQLVSTCFNLSQLVSTCLNLPQPVSTCPNLTYCTIYVDSKNFPLMESNGPRFHPCGIPSSKNLAFINFLLGQFSPHSLPPLTLHPIHKTQLQLKM